MKPVKQSILHDPENNQYGDCFRACIASLLELPIDEVPHVLNSPKPSRWYEDILQWLGKRGLAYIEYRVTDEDMKHWQLLWGVDNLHIYHIITGQSPRDKKIYHSVIGLNGQIVFDPHPDNTGLVSIKSYGFIINACTKPLNLL